MTTTTTNTSSTLSDIDRALAAAKARREAKLQASGAAKAPAASSSESPSPVAPKRPRLSEDDKAARQAQRDQERAARKAERDEKRAAKLAAKAANSKTPHMAKVEKAGEKLPQLSADAQATYDNVISTLNPVDVTALVLHLQFHNRVEATKRALAQKVETNAVVQIVGGDPRYIGMVGVVEKAQRIRCYVAVDGVARPLYLFTSDVQVLRSAAETSEVLAETPAEDVEEESSEEVEVETLDESDSDEEAPEATGTES